MIDVEETERGLRAVDAAKNEVEIELDGWEPGGEELEIDRRVDEVMAGHAKKIKLPGLGVSIEGDGRERWEFIVDESLGLTDGEHLIQADLPITTFVLVDNKVLIKTYRNPKEVHVISDDKIPVTIGFRSSVRFPPERIVIPPNPKGLAYGITEAASTNITETPDRSYPSLRKHPPLFKLKKGKNITGEKSDTDSSILIRVQPSYNQLFVVSTLAYYLGAKVAVNQDVTPSLETTTLYHEFPNDSTFQFEISSLLQRVYYLDCLARNSGPYGLEINELNLVRDGIFDPVQVYSLSMEDRLELYLDFPFESISEGLPEWPLSAHVNPSPANIPIIPHLLEQFALVFEAEPISVPNHELITRSLDDFSRSTMGENVNRLGRDAPFISPVNREGRRHAWMSTGIPVDGYKLLPQAFQNREYYFENRPESKGITAVLNDGGMGSEYSNVREIYRNRAEDIDIDFELKEQLTCSQLHELLLQDRDFLHFIGHCDSAGLKCQDGYLSIKHVPKVRVQSFFLNACNSYLEGLELIRRGSVAGAVTIGDVTDGQAEKVGITFAGLLMRGFSIDRALQFARDRAILNRRYLAIGDGTFSIAQGLGKESVLFVARKLTADKYVLKMDTCSPNHHGAVIQPITAPIATLSGNGNPHSVSGAEFEELLEITEDPVLYEGGLFWPHELREALFE